MPERIDHFELLCRVAESHEWRVHLHSDHFGGRPGGDDLTSQLTMLEVTDGGLGMIARATILPSDRLSDIATLILRRMKTAGLFEERKRS